MLVCASCHLTDYGSECYAESVAPNNKTDSEKEGEKVKFYTVEEVEDLLKVSESTVWRWLNSGELEGFKAGKREWRISEEAIQDFVQRKTEEAKAKKEAKHD